MKRNVGIFWKFLLKIRVIEKIYISKTFDVKLVSSKENVSALPACKQISEKNARSRHLFHQILTQHL